MRTVVGSKDSLDYMIYKEAGNGGYWQHVHRKMGDSKLKDICQEFCNYADGCKPEWARARVVDGILPGKMVPEVAPALFDSNLQRRLNDESTWKFLQFSDGSVFNRETCTVEAGCAEHYISLTTGYKYPAAEMQAIRNRLADKGLDLQAILEEVKAFEDQPPVGDYVSLPSVLERKLDEVASTDGMELLKIIYAMFESWPVTVYRGGKLLAGGLYAVPFEIFMHDRGDDGNNGKTVLQSISAVLAGDYFATITDSMLEKRPPHPSQPDAALFALIGRRLFGTPEVEDDIKVQSSWVKKLADPATVWAAREPFATARIDFKLAALFSLSTNAKLNFTRMDGGVMRRGEGCACPFIFGNNPTPGTNQRQQASWNLKDANQIRQHLAGLYFFVETVFKVFYRTGYHKLPSNRVPKAIKEATDELRQEEIRGIMEEICATEFEETNVQGDALTLRQAKKTLCTHPDVLEATKDKAQISASADMILKPCTISGKRFCKYNGSLIKRHG
jgi:hypothetical protein